MILDGPAIDARIAGNPGEIGNLGILARDLATHFFGKINTFLACSNVLQSVFFNKKEHDLCLKPHLPYDCRQN